MEEWDLWLEQDLFGTQTPEGQVFRDSEWQDFAAALETLQWFPQDWVNLTGWLSQDWVDTVTGETLTAEQARAMDQAQFEADAAAFNAPAGTTGDFGISPGNFGISPSISQMLNDPALEGKAVVLDAAGNMTRIVNIDGSPVDAGWLNTFLRSPVGQLMATLGLGAVGMGIASALSPGPSTLRLPQVPMNPVQEAGQRQLLDTIFSTSPDPVAAIRQAVLSDQLDPASAAAALRALGVADPEGLVESFLTGGGLTGTAALRAAISSSFGGQAEVAEALRQIAERARVAGTQQAPIQDLIRSLGLAQVPEAVATPEPFDLVGAGIRNRVIEALLGERVDPALERRIAEERETLTNRIRHLYPQSQPEEGTVGGALLQGYNQRANELRYNVNRDILQLLAPQEQARTAYEAGRRDTRLGQNVTLSGFGLTPPRETAETLSRMMPIQPLLGISDTTGRDNAQLAAQTALAAFNAEQAGARDQTTAIMRLFGQGAEAFTRPRYLSFGNPVAYGW